MQLNSGVAIVESLGGAKRVAPGKAQEVKQGIASGGQGAKRRWRQGAGYGPPVREW